MSYLLDSDGLPLTADTFSMEDFLSDVDPRLLEIPEGRRELTKYNPLLFMLLYLPHMMRAEETGNILSVNEMNLVLSRHALEWLIPRSTPKRPGLRRAYLAPRGSSKSSTAKGCVLWAAAHGHLKYILLFSGSDVQAEKHLQSIKQEVEQNELLRADFPDFCISSRKRTETLASFDANRKNVYRARSRVTIEARSITSSVLGSKEGDLRPQLILLDDVSRAEGTGSVYQAAQRLEVLIGTVLPLNINAPVCYLATNHHIGSIEDDMMRSLSLDPGSEPIKWIDEEVFEVNWIKPIIERPDGSLRSIWEERWSLEYLLSERHKRSFQKDMMNLPVPMGAEDWFSTEDFKVEHVPAVSKWIISVDPGISSKGDPTGIAIVGMSFAVKKAVVFEAMAVQLKSVDLKRRIMDLLQQYPDITDLVWEATQGGEFLADATLGASFPVRVRLIHPKASKLERAEILLTRYRRGQVVHTKKLPAYEAEALTLPFYTHSPNMVDAVGQGVEYLAKVPIPGTRPVPSVRVRT